MSRFLPDQRSNIGKELNRQIRHQHMALKVVVNHKLQLIRKWRHKRSSSEHVTQHSPVGQHESRGLAEVPLSRMFRSSREKPDVYPFSCFFFCFFFAEILFPSLFCRGSLLYEIQNSRAPADNLVRFRVNTSNLIGLSGSEVFFIC